MNKKILTCSLVIICLVCISVVVRPMYTVVLATVVVAAALFMMDGRIILIAIILFAEKFLYFIDVMEYIPYFYYPSQLLSVFIIVLAVINIKKIIAYDYVFKGPFFIIAIVYLIGSIIPFYTIGQDIGKALFPLLVQFSLLGYFLFVFLVSGFKNYDKILSVIMLIGFVISTLFILQFFLYPKIIFLELTFSQRYGDVRIHEIGGLLPISFFMIIERIFKKKINLFVIINLVVHAFTLFYISKARVLSLAILLALIIMLMLQKKIPGKFIIMSGSLVILCTVGVFLVFNIGLDYVNDIFREITTEGGTAGSRFEAAEYFFRLVKENPVFGKGLYNIAESAGYYLSGRARDLFITDVGLLGYSAMFGIMGVLAFIYLWGRGLLIAIRLYKRNPGNLFPIAFVIFNIISSVTIVWIYLTPSNIYIAMFFAYCDVIYNKMKRGNLNEGSYDITGTVPTIDSG